jgi:PPK2 family polyphosphate:nucleotide phosphotransferase
MKIKTMDLDFSDNYIVKGKFSLKKANTEYGGKLEKSAGKKMLAEEKVKLRELQEKLYGDGSKSLLIVIQAMDAAGKDSLIEHVFGGVNPQGCEVTNFKTPSSKEYSHDFLWRHYIALPEKGKIGIFNRSHYESVLVCKVHPQYNLSEKVWKTVDEIDAQFWKNRYESIRNFEKNLAANGTTIIKIFLNVSPNEQKKRFLDRINEPDKNWKFSLGDLPERKLWDQYMTAYEEAINETSKDIAPWFVIPADHKWFTRVAAIQIIIDALEKMDLKYPKLSDEALNGLEEAKKQLENE